MAADVAAEPLVIVGNVTTPVKVGLAFGANVLVFNPLVVSSTYFFVAACKSPVGACPNVTVPVKVGLALLALSDILSEPA